MTSTQTVLDILIGGFSIIWSTNKAKMLIHSGGGYKRFYFLLVVVKLYLILLAAINSVYFDSFLHEILIFLDAI